LNVEGKSILVTGSTDGIGKHIALGLSRKGAKVLLHGRDQEKSDRVWDEIAQKTGNNILELFIADLASQKQVYNLAAEITDRGKCLHVLINNAGTY